MPRVIDLNDKKQIPANIRDEVLPNFLWELYTAAFIAKGPLDNFCKQAKGMVDMQFMNEQMLNNPNYEDRNWWGDKVDTDDYESMTYDPMSARMVKALAAHLRRIGIPANRQFFKLNLEYNTQLTDRYHFLSTVLEESWSEFLTKAFKRCKAIPKLIKAQKQSIQLGNTVVYVDYDKPLGVVNVKPVKLQNFALYPPKDDVSNCAMVIRSNIAESDLKVRFDLDEKRLDMLVPATEINSRQIVSDRGETDSQPYGTVRVWTFFLPYYKQYKTNYETQEKEKFELRNALVMMGINENTQDGKPEKVILHILELDSREQNPISFSTLTAGDIDSPYNKPELVDYRGHQATLNRLDSAADRAIPMFIDPIKIVSGADPTNTSEDYEVGPGTVLFESVPNAIRFETPRANLEHYILYKDHVTADYAKGFGITENLEGVQRSSGGDKTAKEVESERQSGEAKIDYIAEWQNDGFFEDFLVKYLNQTQLHIQQEIEAAKIIWQATGQPINKSFWDFAKGLSEVNINNKIIKNPCPLYRNFIVWSKVEQRLKQQFLTLNNIAPELATPDLFKVGIAEQIFNDPNQGSEILYKIITEPFDSTGITIEGSIGEASRAREAENFNKVMNFLGILNTPDPTGTSLLSKSGLQINTKEAVRLALKVNPIPSDSLVIPIPTQPNPMSQQLVSTQPQAGQEQVQEEATSINSTEPVTQPEVAPPQEPGV